MCRKVDFEKEVFTMSDKLSTKEKTEIVIQSSLQLIPYIGGPLAAAYYGTKQEKRFKRLESFYQEIADKVQKLKLQFAPITAHDEEKLIALIEELNEKVEREHSQKKREYFKQFFISTLTKPTDDIYDERRYFLDTLFNMTPVECVILSACSEMYALSLNGLQDDANLPTDPYVVVGAISRLKNYGFLRTKFHPLNLDGSDSTFDEVVAITDFGRRFVEYCLQDEA